MKTLLRVVLFPWGLLVALGTLLVELVRESRRRQFDDETDPSVQRRRFTLDNDEDDDADDDELLN